MLLILVRLKVTKPKDKFDFKEIY